LTFDSSPEPYGHREAAAGNYPQAESDPFPSPALRKGGKGGADAKTTAKQKAATAEETKEREEEGKAATAAGDKKGARESLLRH